MMELKKETVQMLRVKSKAASQVTFDEDYNVPDTRPDIGRMIQSKAEISMDEVRLSEGRAFLKGSLNRRYALCRGEGRQNIQSGSEAAGG